MDVEGFSVNYNRFRLYVQYNDNGYSRIEARLPQNFQVVKMPEFKGADQVYIGRSTRMGRWVTVGVETSLRPRTSYVFDWKTNKLIQWIKPSLPEVDVKKFTKSVLEYYPARDGEQIPMLVTRPSECANKACPVIVSFHGGPEGQSRPGFNRAAQLFAMSGFIYVEPNVRGSDGYGKEWFHADDGPKRLQVITDIEDAATFIKNTWVKNGQAGKIGVMGGSYGGYSTLMAMTRFAGSYDAGVAIVGMSDLRTFLANTAPYRRILRASEYGDLEKDHDALTELSPVTYLDRIKDPLMIIQGVSDPRVPAGEAIQIKNALDAKGLSSPLILFADEGHGSVKRDNKVLELGHTLLFFQQHLL
jgi:dipeptidyl aminopeptidase/acylaminoacyl peptidase